MQPTAAEIAFEKDVPADMHEDVMQMIAEAAQSDQYCGDAVTILDRDRIDAINVMAHGIVRVGDDEFTFIVEDGNWNGTVLRSWNDGAEFEYHQPTRWALQPQRHLIHDAVMRNEGAFLLFKWDAYLKGKQEVAAIPGKYTYDRRMQPGGKVETYWRKKAAEHGFDIVTEDEAAETRAVLQG